MRNLSKYRNLAFENKETIKQVQTQLLQEHLMYCLNNSSFYKKYLGNRIEDISKINLKNFKNIPLTEKSFIEENNNGFCAVDSSQIVDIVLSSGTTGQPIKIMYTEHDLKRLAYNEEKSFIGCGLTKDDIVLLTCTMDRCFIAGLAYFLGITSLGAAAIRNGHGSLDSHSEIIQNMKTTVIVGVPSFLKKLGIYMQKENKDPASSSVTKMVCIGEPLRNEKVELLDLGIELEKIWNAKVYSTYASSETITTFCECEAQCGGHLHPDLAIIEIIDEQGNVIKDRGIGEIVVTPLGIEGMPLVRYKTDDISFLMNEPCKCGRNSMRLGPIVGRKNQMMKIKGTTLYPQAVYNALDSLNFVQEYYIEVTNDIDLSDNLIIHIAVNEQDFDLQLLQDRLQSRLRVKPNVILEKKAVIKKIIYTQEIRKPIRFFDRRK
ncbi:MAG: AMP-binding protein [Candidatus Omnitrophica bacterium]|nr:AMP-binding protein [Candidatus Omnitrophota bacterium]